MCTVVVLHRPGHDWPLLLAANRDERLDRAWDLPAAYWPEYPHIVAGRDRSAGGTWMGMNRAGVVAAVLNRQGTLGPADGKRSRGELPLMALAHDTAEAAAAEFATLNGGAWRGFNLVVADAAGAFFVRGVGHGPLVVERLPEGVSMVTAHDPNDYDSPRVARHLPRFEAEPAPTPNDWNTWETILSDRSGESAQQLNVVPRGGFGTVSSSLVALPANGTPIWRFAAGPPHRAVFEPIDMAQAG